ncbi:MAG TPA: PilZ domain-containing protein [Blastocatellia bacterium]|nr:PilZ domain-containing protein [Blastocatellia bacterium]
MKAIAVEEMSAPEMVGPITSDAPENTVSDRRKYVARIPIDISLRVATSRFSAPARTIDVSVTGLQVRTRLPLTLGERVILTFQTGNNQPPLNLCAEVVRVQANQESAASALVAPAEMAEVLSEVARLSTSQDLSAAPAFGLRILRDDSPAWQSFVRLQVLS